MMLLVVLSLFGNSAAVLPLSSFGSFLCVAVSTRRKQVPQLAHLLAPRAQRALSSFGNSDEAPPRSAPRDVSDRAPWLSSAVSIEFVPHFSVGAGEHTAPQPFDTS